MIPYQKQKIENAICFFASEYKLKTNNYLYSTFLYKFLAFLDFESIKKNGKPSLGLTYMAMEYGPVPLEIYNKRNEIISDCFAFKSQDKDNKKFIILPKGEPNLDFFSDWEVNEIYRLIEIYADIYVKTDEISEASHKEIMAWRRAHNRKPNSIMDFKEEFPGEILNKSFDKISPQEENLLFYLSIKNA